MNLLTHYIWVTLSKKHFKVFCFFFFFAADWLPMCTDRGPHIHFEFVAKSRPDSAYELQTASATNTPGKLVAEWGQSWPVTGFFRLWSATVKKNTSSPEIKSNLSTIYSPPCWWRGRGEVSWSTKLSISMGLSRYGLTLNFLAELIP